MFLSFLVIFRDKDTKKYQLSIANYQLFCNFAAKLMQI